MKESWPSMHQRQDGAGLRQAAAKTDRMSTNITDKKYGLVTWKGRQIRRASVAHVRNPHRSAVLYPR